MSKIPEHLIPAAVAVDETNNPDEAYVVLVLMFLDAGHNPLVAILTADAVLDEFVRWCEAQPGFHVQVPSTN